MRNIDTEAIQTLGIPGSLLMENAGRAVADHAESMLSAHTDGVIILCGPGNNGGDGLVAARFLHQRGYSVIAYLFSPPAKLRGDAAHSFERARDAGVMVHEVGSATDLERLHHSVVGSDLLIDALLGTGSKGAPRGMVGEAVTALSDVEIAVLSVDIPTGLDSDTGQIAGNALQAQTTVTMGLPKVGMYFPPGCQRVGKLVVVDIGFPKELLLSPPGGVEVTEQSDLTALVPTLPSTVHKGDCGKVVIVAGSTGMTGAAALACSAALRVGAGLVYLAIPESLNTIVEVLLPEVISIPLPEDDGAHCPSGLSRIKTYIETAQALLIGPGIGRSQSTGELVRQILESWNGPTVLDADGLYHVTRKMTFHPRLLLTPHFGEMARLREKKVADLMADRLAHVRAEAVQRKAAVLLKGMPTVIASQDTRVAINLTGNAGLATGGSGDVLAGIVTGIVAQGAEIFPSAQAGAFIHGLAADHVAQSMPHAAILPSDLLRSLPEALRMVGCGDRSEPIPWWRQNEA
jgi:NAD(P)H-hydrate epimerase